MATLRAMETKHKEEMGFKMKIGFCFFNTFLLGFLFLSVFLLPSLSPSFLILGFLHRLLRISVSPFPIFLFSFLRARSHVAQSSLKFTIQPRMDLPGLLVLLMPAPSLGF